MTSTLRGRWSGKTRMFFEGGGGGMPRLDVLYILHFFYTIPFPFYIIGSKMSFTEVNVSTLHLLVQRCVSFAI